MLDKTVFFILSIGLAIVVLAVLLVTPFFDEEEDCGWDDDAHKGE